MKKNLLIFTFLLFQNAFAQITTKDLNFATSGIFTNSVVNSSGVSNILENFDQSIYFTYLKGSTSDRPNCQTILSKLTSNGSIDTSFGNSGELSINMYSNNTFILKQPDNKILIMGFDYLGSYYTNTIDIIRILPNGQLDNTFGTNGKTMITNITHDMSENSAGMYLQNGKIIIYGVETQNNGIHLSNRIIHRLNSNGTFDFTFGNSGTIITQGNTVLQENNANIVSISDNGLIEKYNLNGQPLTSFGTNGTLQLQFSLNTPYKFYIDNNNKILYSNSLEEMKRINSDGSLDTNFNYSLNSSFPTSIFKILEKDGFYYIGGNRDDTNNSFIAKLSQNGSLDAVFGSYTESVSSLSNNIDLSIGDNYIIALTSGRIVKYSIINSSLSTNDNFKNLEFHFDNPVRESFRFIENQKISSIQIYSPDGKIIKNFKENDEDVSNLSYGVYILQINFENGAKKIYRKMIKH